MNTEMRKLGGAGNYRESRISQKQRLQRRGIREIRNTMEGAEDSAWASTWYMYLRLARSVASPCSTCSEVIDRPLWTLEARRRWRG